jgi:hypothetical protein
MISPSSSLISPTAIAFVEAFEEEATGFWGFASGDGVTVLEVFVVVIVVVDCELLGDEANEFGVS